MYIYALSVLLPNSFIAATRKGRNSYAYAYEAATGKQRKGLAEGGEGGSEALYRLRLAGERASRRSEAEGLAPHARLGAEKRLTEGGGVGSVGRFGAEGIACERKTSPANRAT